MASGLNYQFFEVKHTGSEICPELALFEPDLQLTLIVEG